MLAAARRLLFALALLVFVSSQPATVAAQGPSCLTQWSTGIGFTCIATDAAGDVYITGSYGAQVFKYTGTGTPLTQWHTLWAPDEYLGGLNAIGTDASGDVYVADTYNNRVQKFTNAGVPITQWGTPGSGAGQFNEPGGIAVNSSGEVFVSDTKHNRIQKFGSLLTPTHRASWGSLKTRYR